MPGIDTEEGDIEGRAETREVGRRLIDAWPLVLTYAWLMAMSFLQQPGRTTFDTKFDLTANPGPFLARSLTLWNPGASFGELQNQAYGYLFPQGTFFLLGDVAGLPDWVTQRLWSGLVLIVAFEGCRRLVLALMPGCSAWAAWLGAASYAAAPRLLGLSGVLSGEVLPTAVLPWVVLPIVLAHRGRLTPRTAAAASGVAMLFLGGVNAVGNLATLPVVLLVVLAGRRRPGGGDLVRWWLGAVVLASAWWALPLLVLGRFSPPFLDYIETSSAVERPLGWTNVTRGADHWVGYFEVGGEPWWPGSYLLATSPLLIAVTALVAGLGLWGLTRSTMPLRRALLASLLLGALCLTLPRDGSLASPLQGPVQGLLDGALAMLRNVHKVDPLLRLPLALGLAHLATRWSDVRMPRLVTAAPLVNAVVLVLVLLSAQPLWTGQMRKEGWETVPEPWEEAAAFLDGVDGTGSALILPGASFGLQTWGATIDEPMQGLAETPWVTRSQVPLTPGPTIRLLDAVQERVADGRGSPVLADLLARSGIEYVVVRRDLELTSGAADLGRVDLALTRSPGLRKVAGFGSTGLGDQALIDVLEVEPAAQRVVAVPTSDVLTLAGSSEDVLTAMEAGVLDPTTPVVVEGEENWPVGVPDLVGDGLRKRERGFGALEATGPVMALDEEHRYRRAAYDFAGPESTAPLYADYGDAVSTIVASSSAAYSDSFGESRPDNAPHQAFDGDDSTYWQSAPLLDPVGQWVEVRFREDVAFPGVTVSTRPLETGGAELLRVRVTAGTNDVTVPVDPETGLATAALRGTFDRVRVTVEETRDGAGAAGSGVVAITEVSLPDLVAPRSLAIPADGADAGTTFVLRAAAHRRTCLDAGLGTNCWPVTGARTSDEEAGLFRRLTVDEATSWQVSGTVVARATDGAQRLLAPLGGVRATASSVYLGEPGVAAQLATDADPETFWAAAQGDEEPTLRLAWDTPVTIDELRVTAAPDSMAPPTTAVVVAGEETRRIDLSSGVASFAPLRAESMEVRFDAQPSSDRPLGVAEVSAPALRSLVQPLTRKSATGAICGLGPEIVVDGAVYPTRVAGVIGDVVDGTAMTLESCGGPVTVAAGTHEVDVVSTAQFAPTSVVLRPSDLPDTALPPQESTSPVVRAWGSTRRLVRLEPGPERLLVVNENFNPGWEASSGDDALKPVRVDGWKQGFVVPAGSGGDVEIAFTPGTTYRVALLAGLLGALALAVALVRGLRSDRRRVPCEETDGAAGLTCGGDVGRPSTGWVVVGVATLALLGGPAVALGLLVGVVARRVLGDPGLVGALLVGGAGVAAAVVAVSSPGLPPLLCDLVAGTGVGCLGVALLTGVDRRAEAAPSDVGVDRVVAP
ncbi:alpha-(1-_3)-arabinofuranosyltransferase family protein [Nocardioides sp. 1609]|uniref:alpha-(1->3)-arabinofuranosyltransferase domain-containing protein n=1 Tax=Nocardioides sp. 1609 TaxID=2508327 RepID=UPI00106F178C|nr:alpha-(1->3)-arabinofuranosyltransferase family protein [Nocardioides sp. 1609]